MIKIRRVLISVFDKIDLDELAKFLVLEQGAQLLSTGGTAKHLREVLQLPVTDVSEVTNFPEMLGGRVKTLHPAIHGGLLAVRDDATHVQQLEEHNIQPIDLVILNLYPFEAASEQFRAKQNEFKDCVELIDIGGPAMIRSSAKNHRFVTVVTDRSQYSELLSHLRTNSGQTSESFRRNLAASAFATTSRYDYLIADFLRSNPISEDVLSPSPAAPSPSSPYTGELLAMPQVRIQLKYGINPHQAPSHVASSSPSGRLPFAVLNGSVGYINVLDALNAWQLVSELSSAIQLPTAASFKHVSPAGVGVGLPLSKELAAAYEIPPAAEPLSLQALAYLRARNADPMSSFGDFAAVSGIVDVSTAQLLKVEVSDGIIARGYEAEALEILKSKKNGTYVVLQADANYKAPDRERREVFGVVLEQKRNDARVNSEVVSGKIVTSSGVIPETGIRDLIIATVTVKYTQSNSVCYAVDGQVVGVGAGQQSRVDCVKLAGRKVDTWALRTHPKVSGLPFKQGVKRVDRINARVRYIEGDMTLEEYRQWVTLFDETKGEIPSPLTQEEKAEWFSKTLSGVALSSDAFFPFRDSIDQAAKRGVKFIVQPGGSAGDSSVISACEDYKMTMSFSGVRHFHH